jgi:hypothetical protein
LTVTRIVNTTYLKELNIMGASHNIKLGKDNGVDIARGVEANDAPAECFVLVTDENDRLYCPGVLDEPSPALVQSMRNGWEKGSLLKCVNRGKKGGKPVLVVGEGRSRLKAVHIVNTEREADGLPLIRPEFVLMTEDEAYEAMHTSANKQERKPSFEARCWAQFKRIYALEKLGKTALEEGEAREARKAYSELRKCTSHQIKVWEQILSAHPEVLRMFDAKEPGMNRAALLDIVDSTEFAKQPEAARKVVALAKVKQAPVADAVTTESVSTNAPIGNAVESTVTTPDTPSDKPSRGTRSERSDRREALGIGTARPITARKLAELLIELRKVDEPELVDPRVMLAFILGETEFDGLPISDHPSMGEVVRLAKRTGIKVTK